MLRRRLPIACCFAVALLEILGQAACNPDAEPLDITLVPPIGARVGVEVSVPLAVATFDESVTWIWSSKSNPDLAMRLRRPTLTTYTAGRAVWRWTPLADDAGQQEIEFVAHTDSADGKKSLQLEVDSGSEPPLFREPVGEGTALDLRRDDCAHIDIVVESTASPRVEITLVDMLDSARLVQTGDLTGELAFCPTPVQIAADTVYPFTLRAESVGQVALKSYVIVLRRAS